MSSNRNYSKIGSSGQMIMSNPTPNNNQGMNYQNSNNMMMPNLNYNMPIAPMNMQYNQGYGMNYYNPMMMQQPYMMNNPNMNNQYGIGYNPYNMVNQSPLNNYNRNNNLNVGNMGNYNNIPNSNGRVMDTPVRIMDNNHLGSNRSNIENSNIQPREMSKRELDREKYKRSNSSKNRLNNDSSYISNNQNSYINTNDKSGPATNPESFSRRRNSTNNYDGGNYKPYTLKDYKEISSAKIVLGSLGPNIGTKDWEEKNDKMRKRSSYATDINKANKVILKYKKETPVEQIEKEKKNKIESSTRFKSYEYAKLVKPRPKYEGYEYNENTSENQYKYNIDYNNNSDRDKLYSPKPNTNHNSNNIRYTDNEYVNNSNMSHDTHHGKYDQNDNNINNLQKKREVYNYKINEIKEALLK